MQGAAGPPGDHDHLGVRRQRAGSVRAVVRCVEAPVLGHHLAQGHQLVGVGVHPGRVGQAAAQPDGSVDQTLPDHVGHPGALGGRRGPVVVAHHQHPHGALRHQVRGVAGDPRVQRVQVVGHPRPAEAELRVAVPAGQLGPQGPCRDLVRRGEGESVLAEHLAGDALAHLGEMIVVDQDLHIGVGVQVDEARRQHPPVRPDRPPRRFSPTRPGVIATIRSPVIATSAVRPGAPVPSTTRASVISRSGPISRSPLPRHPRSRRDPPDRRLVGLGGAGSRLGRA